MNLGRSGSHLIFKTYTVIKPVRDIWEPCFMREHPGVFVPVTRFDERSFEMPRLEAPSYRDPSILNDAAPLLALLWAEPEPAPNPLWAVELYAHLDKLQLIPDAQLTELVARLPRPTDQCIIHGDPTLANLLWSQQERQWRWCDPLRRSYIPGDPHVDLGKLYQSCLGYERVLLGMAPQRDDKLMIQLAVTMQLNVVHGLLWTAVHLMRLIPYQREDDKPLFRRMLTILLDEVL